MKTNQYLSRQKGYSLLGLLASSVMTTVLSAVVYGSIIYGMAYFSNSKNNASRLAQQQARGAALQIEQDIHSALSTPELVNADREMVSDSGKASGIAFDVFVGG